MRTDLREYIPPPELPDPPKVAEATRPKPISLTDAKRTHDDHPDMLFRRRVLKRGETWLLCGPTGVGKSVITVESAVHWALGREFFGFDPVRRLSSVIFVAEDDEDEMAWFRDGVFRRLDLDDEERAEVGRRVRFIVCGDLAGEAFVAQDLRPTLEALKPDLAHLNPGLAYIGGEASDQAETARFLRSLWHPAIVACRVGGFLYHHTPKQSAQSRKAEKDRFLSDYSYAGFGSAEWSNYPRGILVLEPTVTPGLFKFICPKRGQRLDWTDPDGKPTGVRFIKHATEPGTLGWVDAEAADIPRTGRGPAFNPEDMLGLLAKKSLSTAEWFEVAHTEQGASRSTFFAIKRELEKAGRIGKSATSGGWYVVQKPR